MPKTALGKRAAIEQANQLGLLDPNDPDQKYALLSQFGLSDLVPSLNFHVQAALQLQDSFEKWVQQPQGPSTLQVKPWFDLNIHWVERIKWLNTDRMREMMATNPMIEQIVTLHLQQMQMLMVPPVQLGPDGKPIEQEGGGPPGAGPKQGSNAPGGGQAMTQSNKQSGGLGGGQSKPNNPSSPSPGTH